MTPHLIELRDSSVSVHTADDVLARSPGFANVAGKVPVFGEEARQQARLHPRQNFNQFWWQLSLDPLPEKTSHFRHSADLAYGHLSSLTKPLDLANGAIIAAPSNYTRNQLAVLLGVVKQCTFDIKGLVDVALLHVAGSDSDDCIFIDMQLHQTVLSSFRRINGYLLKEKVIQVPFTGLLALQDAWIALIAEEFIRQSRFDPLRNAETEQYLHNQLEGWLQASLVRDELQLEINHKGTVHQVHLTPAHFEQRGQAVFNRINKELAELRTAATALHVKTSLMYLPGMARTISGLIALDDNVLMQSCQRYLEFIRRAPDNLQFVTRLPVGEGATAAVPAQSKAPTHVLHQNKAILLPTGRLAFGSPGAPESARMIPIPGFTGAISFVRNARGVQLELHTSEQVLHNGQPAEHGKTLQLGDRVKPGNDQELQLIVVEQGS